MAEKQYNFIYSKLVSSEDDVMGLLAYSIYKRHKIEFIEDFKKKKGTAPTDSDIESFIMSSVTESQLAKYKESAAAILGENVASAVRDELNNINFDFQKSVEPVVKKHTYSAGKTIFLNVIASFIFSLILVVVFMLGYTTESGLRKKTKAVIETIQDAQTEQISDSTQIK